MEIKQIEFRFKGGRDYIHGTDMFNVMMEEIKTSSIHKNIRFTIHDFVHTAMCKLYLTKNKSLLNDVKGLAVRCQLDIDGATHWMAISQDDNNNTVGEKYSSHENQIATLCSVDGDSININQSSPCSFIETIVAMNKQMHQQLFSEVNGAWVFTGIYLPVLCDAKEKLVLRLRHNMNYRLTKSDIEVDGNKVGDIFFSLVNT